MPYDQGVWIGERLEAADVPVELMPIEGGGHGFNSDDTQRRNDAMLVFFDKNLKRPQP